MCRAPSREVRIARRIKRLEAATVSVATPLTDVRAVCQARLASMRASESGSALQERMEVERMGKVAPYHSSNPADPDVYHDQSECPSGQQIPAKNKLPGTGGNRKCEHCIKMG